MSSAVGDDERWEERDETRRQREGAWACYRGGGRGGWGVSPLSRSLEAAKHGAGAREMSHPKVSFVHALLQLCHHAAFDAPSAALPSTK